MPQGELDHFPNQCHLFSAASDIIVTDVIKLLLILSVYGFAFSVKHSARGNNAVVLRFGRNDLEFDWLEVSSDNKEITLFDWPVRILEVRDQESFGEITSNTLNGVLNG